MNNLFFKKCKTFKRRRCDFLKMLQLTVALSILAVSQSTLAFNHSGAKHYSNSKHNHSMSHKKHSNHRNGHDTNLLNGDARKAYVKACQDAGYDIVNVSKLLRQCDPTGAWVNKDEEAFLQKHQSKRSHHKNHHSKSKSYRPELICTFPKAEGNDKFQDLVSKSILLLSVQDGWTRSLYSIPLASVSISNINDLKRFVPMQGCLANKLKKEIIKIKDSKLSVAEQVDKGILLSYLDLITLLVKTKSSGVKSMYTNWHYFDGGNISYPYYNELTLLFSGLDFSDVFPFKDKYDLIRYRQFLKDNVELARSGLENMKKGVELGYRAHIYDYDTFSIAPDKEYGSLYAFFDITYDIELWGVYPGDMIEDGYWTPYGGLTFGFLPGFFGITHINEIDRAVADGEISEEVAEQEKMKMQEIHDDQYIRLVFQAMDYAYGPYTVNARTADNEFGVWAIKPDQPEVGAALYQVNFLAHTSYGVDDDVYCIRKKANATGTWTPTNETYEFFLLSEPNTTSVQKLFSCGIALENWFQEQKLYWKAQYEQSLRDDGVDCTTLIGNASCTFDNVEDTANFIRERKRYTVGVDYLCHQHYNKSDGSSYTSTEENACQIALASNNVSLKPKSGLFTDNFLPGADGIGNTGVPTNTNVPDSGRTLFFDTRAAEYRLAQDLIESEIHRLFSDEVINLREQALSNAEPVIFSGGGNSGESMGYSNGQVKIAFPTRDPAGQYSSIIDTVKVHELFLGHALEIPFKDTFLSSVKDISAVRNADLGPFGRGEIISTTFSTEGYASYTEILALENGYLNKVENGVITSLPDPGNYLLSVIDTSRVATRIVAELASNTLQTPLSPMSQAAVLDRFRTVANADINAAVGYAGRIIQNPGQQLGYGAGMMAILALRHQAQVELGAQFDIKEFHDVILKQGGGATASVLRSLIENYIAEKQGGQ